MIITWVLFLFLDPLRSEACCCFYFSFKSSLFLSIHSPFFSPSTSSSTLIDCFKFYFCFSCRLCSSSQCWCKVFFLLPTIFESRSDVDHRCRLRVSSGDPFVDCAPLLLPVRQSDLLSLPAPAALFCNLFLRISLPEKYLIKYPWWTCVCLIPFCSPINKDAIQWLVSIIINQQCAAQASSLGVFVGRWC